MTGIIAAADRNFNNLPFMIVSLINFFDDGIEPDNRCAV
jgi:hypothetical protein